MGNNVAGGLGGAYQPGKQLDLRNTHWQMYEASKKDTNSGATTEVTIFKFLKSQADRLVVAQRGVQKLRTMKHPFILSFVDSNAEDKDALLLVTEACVPLSVWLDETVKECRRSDSSSSNSTDGSGSMLNQALWGFRCIVQAIDFLHTKCNIGHNNINTNSIFVMRNGDWKLGCLDFAANPSTEKQFLRENMAFIPRDCIPQEVSSHGWGDNLKDADVYCLGRLMTQVLEAIGEVGGGKVSDALRRSMTRMISSDPEKRPNSTQILKYPDFNSDFMKVLVDLDDFSLKSPQEVLEVLKKVQGKAKEFPKQLCGYKITPLLIDRLRIASNDFQNRDMREYCRGVIDVCVDILASFVEGDKVNDSTLTPQASETLSLIWTMPDRTVRTCLLRTCKHLIVLFPAAAVNKSLFQPVLAGFSDSNPKMREETLKNLVHFVEKLDETNLQERLVRQVKALQDDTEKSIRTNAVIFLSRIAPKLSAATRGKTLAPCFVKAMRDGFVPCRSAGLKASQSCYHLIDPLQICTVILPQVCLLLVDPAGEVRSGALVMLESSVQVIQGLHTTILEQETRAREQQQRNNVGGMQGGNLGGSGGDESPTTPNKSSGGWGSWAVGEISKTLEKAVISETSHSNYNSNDIKSHIGELKGSLSSSHAILSSSSSSSNGNSSSKPIVGGMNLPKGKQQSSSITKSSSLDSGIGSGQRSGLGLGLGSAAPEANKARVNKLPNSDSDDDDDVKNSSKVNSAKGSGWDDDINWSEDDEAGDSKAKGKSSTGGDSDTSDDDSNSKNSKNSSSNSSSNSNSNSRSENQISNSSSNSSSSGKQGSNGLGIVSRGPGPSQVEKSAWSDEEEPIVKTTSLNSKSSSSLKISVGNSSPKVSLDASPSSLSSTPTPPASLSSVTSSMLLGPKSVATTVSVTGSLSTSSAASSSMGLSDRLRIEADQKAAVEKQRRTDEVAAQKLSSTAPASSSSTTSASATPSTAVKTPAASRYALPVSGTGASRYAISKPLASSSSSSSASQTNPNPNPSPPASTSSGNK